jgi:hypothetical protein
VKLLLAALSTMSTLTDLCDAPVALMADSTLIQIWRIEQQIAVGEWAVTKQESVISVMEAGGQKTTIHREALERMRRTVREMRDRHKSLKGKIR